MTLFEQVLGIEENALAPAHPDRLTTEYTLGCAYIETHQYEKAAKVLEKVLERRRKVQDVTELYVLAMQQELARAYFGMGNGHYERAAELFEQVVDIRERTLAPDDPNLLGSHYNLALAYKCLGRGYYEKAARLLKQVIEIEERTFAPDDLGLLQSQQLLEKVHELIEAEKNVDSTSASGEEV